MKKFFVSLQSSATVRFTRMVEAETEEKAKESLIDLFKAINSGLVAQTGECNNNPYGDVSFEITEAPQAGHDFTDDDIEVEEDAPNDEET